MQIQIIAVGNIKENYLKDGVNDYLKRLKSYTHLTITEVNDEKEPANDNPSEIRLIKAKEGERIAKQLKKDTYLIALAIEGKTFSSEQLADHLAQLALNGKSHLTFVIGGSFGLDESITQRADLLLSFSKMTFPHQLMRLILTEQIYRSYRIINHHSYHK